MAEYCANCKTLADEVDRLLGVVDWYEEITRARTAREAKLEDEVARLDKGIRAVKHLITNTYGVDGLHLTGHIAPWGELLLGGRFETWLIDFSKALERGE